MSAPTKAPAEQPTQPLPVAATLPPAHGAFKESGLWLFPGAPLAAVVVGEGLRNYVLLTDAARSDFAIAALLLVFVLAGVALLCSRVLGRRDGRGRH